MDGRTGRHVTNEVGGKTESTLWWKGFFRFTGGVDLTQRTGGEEIVKRVPT